MADEDAIKKNENTKQQNTYFTKLQDFAQICCENTKEMQSLEDDCTKMQLSYWVYQETKKGMQWRDFTPTDRKGQLTKEGLEMCGIKPSSNPDFPLFSYHTGRDNSPKNGAHTEAQLLPRMKRRAGQQRNPTSFFLWTKNSPCGPTRREQTHDCQNKIFNFVATSLVKKGHRLDVGFRIWDAVTNGPGASRQQHIYEDRERFCRDVTSRKSAKYRVEEGGRAMNIDFRHYLGFWKIVNQENIENQKKEVVSDNKYISSIDKMYC